MPRRRTALDLTDYRTVIDTSGEVAVGAYARAQRRRRMVVAGVGLLLTIGAVVVYRSLQPADGSDHGQPFGVRVRCTACGYEGEQRITSSKVLPLACPSCKARTCWPLWVCRKCRTTFLPDLGQDKPTCPNPICHSSEVGSAWAP